MHLKGLRLNNFRKFKSTNYIEFTNPKLQDNSDFNISKDTTLIVGKNNSGKSSIITALEKLINEKSFFITDFNLDYLDSIYKDIGTNSKNLPILEFEIKLEINDNNEDILNNLIQFLQIADTKENEVKIRINWEIKEEEIYRKKLEKLNEGEHTFDDFLSILENTEFKFIYLNENNDIIDNFKLKNLINIKIIKANNITSESCLTKAFGTIIKYRYNKSVESPPGTLNLNNEIKEINSKLSKDIKKDHGDNINDSLKQMIRGNKCQVNLKSSLTFETLMNNVIKYEYLEDNKSIPENQFGLGYTNLMMIVAEIIEYADNYPDTKYNSKINIISIEEPETFMHPQMQELFIKNINKLITSLVGTKKIKSQLIITTHSAHILNSKIHMGNSFDQINYINETSKGIKIVNLRDDIIKPENEKEFNFLKKHIKFKTSEMFFSDAVIFVEGITEYTLLQYYIEKNEKLNKHYITLFQIDGAHAKVYEKLITLLGIPTIIITDLDIKRSKADKEAFKQFSTANIDKINLDEITNTTLKHFKKDLNEILDKENFIESSNICICSQFKSIQDQFSTSFEEALILSNFENTLLKEVLNEVKPQIMQDIGENIVTNSYKLQRKLSGDKSKFASHLLFTLLNNEEEKEEPVLPDYINSGLLYLEEKLNAE